MHTVVMRTITGLAIATRLILLPAGVVAQSHQGLVSLEVVSTLSVSELREWDRLVDRMISENDLVLRAVHDDRSVPDRRHERLGQYYRGVPVYGGDVSRQTARGVTVSMFGAVYTQIDLDPTATLSEDEATAMLENVSGVAGTFRTEDQLRPAEILTLDTRGSEATLDRLLTGVSFDSDIATDADNTWTDAAVVDAHVHIGSSYDYFQHWATR